MEQIGVIIFFILGLLAIIKGGDWFVDASIWIAKVTGIPSIIIGATIVSFATTLPELLVSTNATLKGVTDIAIGNAIGSTICNIGLIAGIIILLRPEAVHRRMFSRKSYLMIGVTLVVAVFSLDNVMTRWESIVLLMGVVLFFRVNIKSYKEIPMKDKQLMSTSRKEVIGAVTKFILGSFLIILGSNLLVDNGIILARIFNIPEAVIGLTLIALGTSLPELVTGIMSIVKKDSAIGLGNIIGANILNIAMIIGTSGLIAKEELHMTLTDIDILGLEFSAVPQTLLFDLPVSLVFMLIMVLPGIIWGKMFKRQGYALLALYGIYVVTLFNLA
jgi:cation:H+ antiporter